MGPAARSFLANLNVFAAAMVAFASMGMAMLVIPISLLAKVVLPSRQAELFAYPAAVAVLAVGLAIVWRRRGLSPPVRKPGSERQFRIGHGMLATGNVALVLTMALPFLLAGRSVGTPLHGLAAAPLLVMSLAPFALFGGLIMVLTARAAHAQAPASAAPAFADTVPQAGNSAQPAPFAPAHPVRRTVYPQAYAKTDAGGWAVVLVGICASGLVLFIGTVFASLSFQGRVEQFTGVVLPIVGVVCVIWLTVSLWLAGAGRARGAAIVAWGPAVLVLVVMPAVSMLAFVVGM
jgi:hypothetical protein